MSFQIIGTGYSHPKYVLTNDELSTMVDTSDEWITTRTGIKSRYIATDETLLDLAVDAARQAVEKSGCKPEEIDLILCSTVQGDCKTPSLACMVQRELGAKCPAMDINAACAGFLYSLDVAAAYMDAGRTKNILVVSAEMMSRHADWTDRATCVLFGDGAGAVMLTKGTGLKAIRITAKGDDRDLLVIGGDKGNSPFQKTTLPPPFLKMAGSEVFRFAVVSMCRDIKKVLAQAGMTVDQLTYVLPHQANMRIIHSAAERLGLRDDQIVSSIARYGNTSSSSIPILLGEMVEQGKIKRGDLLALSAFGGGLTTGACIIEF